MKTLSLNNKKKLIDCLGIGLIVAGIIGLAITLLGAAPKESEDKLHLLCIGVDKYVPMDERVEGSNSIGQADAIFLLSVDLKEKSMDIVSIPRDTIVTIEKYYSDLEYIGQEEAQICLQYAYADGLERSCELMVDRVEELFEGIEIDGYVSFNLSAVHELNHALGGVTVTVEDQITAWAMGVELGSEVMLTWDNISIFIRSRDKQDTESAYERTLRYKEFITAFIEQGIEVVKKDPGVVLTMLEILEGHVLTDLQVSDIANLSAHLVGMSMEDVRYHTLEGNIIIGEDGYAEFYPNIIKLNNLKKQIY